MAWRETKVGCISCVAKLGLKCGHILEAGSCVSVARFCAGAAHLPLGRFRCRALQRTSILPRSCRFALRLASWFEVRALCSRGQPLVRAVSFLVFLWSCKPELMNLQSSLRVHNIPVKRRRVDTGLQVSFMFRLAHCLCNNQSVESKQARPAPRSCWTTYTQATVPSVPEHLRCKIEQVIIFRRG